MEVIVAITKVNIKMPENTGINVVHLELSNSTGVWPINVSERDLDFTLGVLEAGITMSGATMRKVKNCPCGALAKGAMHAGGCPED